MRHCSVVPFFIYFMKKSFVTFVLLFSAIGVCAQRPPLTADSLVSRQAPLFTLPDYAGTPHNLSEYLGHGYTLVEFWASWCSACLMEMPTLKEAYRRYINQGFQIVSVSLDTNSASWLDAVVRLGITWTQLSDVRGWESPVAALYHVTSIPSTFLVDSTGCILAHNLNGEHLLAKLATLYPQQPQ